MRRITCVLGSILFIAALAPAAAGALPEVFAVDHLQGDWVHRPQPGVRSHWYYVEADIVTNVRTGEIVSARARGGVGPCSAGGNFCHISPVWKLHLVRYETDALFGTARLVVRRGDEVMWLDFVANPRTAQPSESIHPCPGEAEAYADVARSASATGTVFGRRVSSRSDWDRSAESMQREIYSC